MSRLPSGESATAHEHELAEEEIVHPVEPRARTAVLPPVMAKTVDEHPLCWVGFVEEAVVTSCVNGTYLPVVIYLYVSTGQSSLENLAGHIRMWGRPKEGVDPIAGSSDGAPSMAGSN